MSVLYFLSYSSHDRKMAYELRDLIRSLGSKCWIAPDSINPGDSYSTAIAQAIRTCDHFLLLFSETADGSEDVANELFLAKKYKKRVVPLRTSEYEPTQLEYHLGLPQWIDLRQAIGHDRLRRLIVENGAVRKTQPEGRHEAFAPEPSNLQLKATSGIGSEVTNEVRKGIVLPGLVGTHEATGVKPNSSVPPRRQRRGAQLETSNFNYWLVKETSTAQTQEFVAGGYWSIGDHSDESLFQMRPDDRIAIKANGLADRDLPFDTRGKKLSTLEVKAVGTIASQSPDGRRVNVRWDDVILSRGLWYWYNEPARRIWRLDQKKAVANGLIAFVFFGQGQDYVYYGTEYVKYTFKGKLS